MIEILKKKIQEAEAIIVGGASGLSTAAGGAMLSAAFKDALASQVCLIAKLVRDLAKHSKHEYL